MTAENVFAWARERAGYQGAPVPGFDDALLESWESGQGAPSDGEARRLGAIYRVGGQTLIRGEIPEWPPFPDLRPHPQKSPGLQHFIDKAQGRYCTAASLIEDLYWEQLAPGTPASNPPGLQGIVNCQAPGETPQDAAAQICKRLGIEPNATLQEWAQQAGEAGILVFQHDPEPRGSFEGLTIPGPLAPVAAISRRQPPAQKKKQLATGIAMLRQGIGGAFSLQSPEIASCVETAMILTGSSSEPQPVSQPETPADLILEELGKPFCRLVFRGKDHGWITAGDFEKALEGWEQTRMTRKRIREIRRKAFESK